MSRSTPWAPLTAVSLFLLAAIPVRAQATAPAFAPIPDDAKSQYHFDFAKDFFATPAAFQAALKTLDLEAASIQKYRGKVIASPQNLYQALKISDDFSRDFQRVYWYLDLKYSVNIKDTADRDQATALDSRLSPQFSFVDVEIQALTPAKAAAYLNSYPTLKLYQYPIEETLRDKPHTLGLKEEELLAKTTPLLTQWHGDEYDLLMDRAPWGTVQDPDTGKALNVRQDYGAIVNSPVRTVRQEGHDKQTAAYESERDLFAFDVINVAKTENQLAQLRGFKNGQDAAYFNLHLSYADIDTAYRQILAHGDLRKRLQTMQRARIGQFTGYDTVHSWDMTMVPPGVVKPRFTIDQARATILDVTHYLGPEYARQMSALLDPANGRLDIVAGENRVPNAFSIPVSGMNSVFYDYAYEGYLNDVSTLAHEAGHVVDSALQNDARVPPATSDGPRFFTESYAILNEIVLRDYLYQHATDPNLKVYYLENLTQEQMSFYGTALIADLEKTMYEGVDKGTITKADDLDAMTTKLGSEISVFYTIEPDAKDLWEVIPHYYGSPTYYVNYVFADLLAQTYFAQYKKDPIAFGKRFTALERNGFNDTPDHLLKKFLNIDLHDPHTYDAVFARHAQYLTELAALYRQVPVPSPATRAADAK